MGINKIVAVTHLGYDSNPDFGNDLQLATYVDGIDIVVGGHSHTQLSEPVVINKDEKGTEKEPTVVVQAYQYSQLLGKLQVEFDGNGVVNGQAGQLIDVVSKEEDSEAAAILAPYKEKITELSTQESGAIAKKTLANPRLTDSDVSVRANETELGNLVTDAMLAKAKERYPETVIAFQNGGGIRAAIEEGPITIGEIISVLPFGNDPVVVELSGEEIKQILEHSVSQAPAESGGFLHVAGMKFTYDSTKESGSRVISMYVKVNGEYQEIQANQKYLVTTNNFTAKGGDGFDVFAKAYQEGRVQDIGEIDWEQLRKYMVEDLGGVVDPVLEGRITDLLGTDPETPGDEEEEVTPEEPEVENPETGGNEDDSSDTDNPTDATGSETDDDNTDIGDNAGIENDTELEQDVNDNQGSKETVSNSSEGNALPNTATSMYTMLLVGGILLVAGIGFLVFRMMKYSKA